MSKFRLMLTNLNMDFQRYLLGTRNPLKVLMKVFHNPGMIFSIFYRLERYFLIESNIIFRFIGIIFYPFYFFVTYYVLSYHIEPFVEIDGGLFLHNRDIVITDLTKIGKNFSIMGQTTIGTNFNVEGVQIIIGDNVQVGVGAKIIASGKLIIADNVTIGANSVVVKNVCETGAICAGIPAKIIKLVK